MQNYCIDRNIILILQIIAIPVTSILTSGEPVYLKPFNLTCRASLNPKVAPQLIQYMVLEWVGPNRESLADQDGITIEQQHILHNTTTRSLTFHPLNMTDGGNYKCEAKLLLQNTVIFNSSSLYHLNVPSKWIS